MSAYVVGTAWTLMPDSKTRPLRDEWEERVEKRALWKGTLIHIHFLIKTQFWCVHAISITFSFIVKPLEIRAGKPGYILSIRHGLYMGVNPREA